MSAKQESSANDVFKMVESLKSRFGTKPEDPIPPEEEPVEAPVIEEPVEPSFEEEPAKEEALVEEFEEDLEEAPVDEPEAESEEESEEFQEANEEEPEEILSGDVAEESEQVIEEILDTEFAEEAPEKEEALEAVEESEELPEEVIYEVPAEEEPVLDEEPEEEENDQISEDQIAMDVPSAEELGIVVEEEPEEPVVEENQEESPAPAPVEAVQEPSVEREPEDYRPSRGVPPSGGQKPIAAEQLTLVNPPVMKAEDAPKPEEAPSVESLERSVPDLSKLSDEERRRRSGLSDEDVRMMLEFGYEDDLCRVLGYRTVRKLKYSGRKASAPRMEIRPFAYSGKEYDGSLETRNEILHAYQKDKKYLLTRLCLTAFFAVVLLVLDLLFCNPPGNMDKSYFWVFLAMSTLLLTFVALVSHRTLKDAYRSLTFFAPTPHAIPALLLPIALGCDICLLVSTLILSSQIGSGVIGLTSLSFEQLVLKFPGESPLEILAKVFPNETATLFLGFPVVNFVTAMVFLLSVVGDLFRFSTEKHAFLVLSAASQKIAAEPYIRRKKKMQRGEEIVSLIDDSPEHAEYRVRPVDRITGFFRRCGNLSDSTKQFSILLSLSFGLSVLGALIAWFAGRLDDVPGFLSTFVSLFFFSAPISSIFAFFYPAGLASRALSRKRSAIVGEESISELTEKKALLFPDSRLFKAGKCTQTPIRSDSDFKEDLRLSGILFRKLGGVLSEIATPLFPEGPDPAVSILRIREDGVEALVDNRYHLLAGSRELLTRYGIRFPAQAEEPKWKSPDSARLYVAIDDVLKLRYDVEYKRIEDFEALPGQFRESQTAIGVYTYDPNLTEAFLQRLYKDDPAPVLVKPGAFDEETEIYVTDAPAVTLDREESLAEPIETAAIIKRARKTGFWVQFALSLAGTLFSSILLLVGKADHLGLGTLISFHIASLIVAWGIVTSRFKHHP